MEHPLVHWSKYVIVSTSRSPDFNLVFWAKNAQYGDVSLKGHHYYKAKIKIAVFDCDGYLDHNFSHLYYTLRHLVQVKYTSKYYTPQPQAEHMDLGTLMNFSI